MPCHTQDMEVSVAAEPNTMQDIARSLHKTAQPLTVLQGVLELALLNAQTTDEYRSSCERALREVGRVSRCFDQVRQMVRSKNSKRMDEVCHE
jgi:hypothetical protein